jgi:endonuclease YncB( thermonuclease family)
VRIGGSGRRPALFGAGSGIVVVGSRLAIAALLVAALAAWAFYDWEGSPSGASAPRAVATSEQTVAVTFSICGVGRRTDCVVDGDTFWFRGDKIRVADIDTPELSPPRCQREAELGEAAKQRLRALLNAGPFTLVAVARDQDQYGRKLRIVSRGGRSIGDTLIAEGLARRWNGPRQSWCSG